MKASMSPFFMFTKLAMIQSLLASTFRLDDFYNNLFAYYFTESKNALSKLHRMSPFSSTWIESERQSKLNQQRLLCEQIVNLSQTHLIFLLNFTCFFEHSTHKWKSLKQFTESNLDLLESVFFTLDKNYLGIMERPLVQRVKGSISALELIRLMHQYFKMLKPGLSYEENKIQKLTENCMLLKFEIFYLNSQRSKNEFQHWMLTYLTQYFFELLNNTVSQKIEIDKSFIKVMILLSSLHYKSYSSLFSSNQPDLSQDMSISLWFFTVSFNTFYKIAVHLEYYIAQMGFLLDT
jgi:hypothetical protein